MKDSTSKVQVTKSYDGIVTIENMESGASVVFPRQRSYFIKECSSECLQLFADLVIGVLGESKKKSKKKDKDEEVVMNDDVTPAVNLVDFSLIVQTEACVDKNTDDDSLNIIDQVPEEEAFKRLMNIKAQEESEGK